MGLWDWIVDKVIAGESDAPTSDNNHSPVDPAGNETAVALLDAPAKSPEDAEPTEGETWWAPEGATRTELATVPRPALSPEALALENLLISHFDGHDLTLPPLLVVAERVRPKLSDPKCDLSKIAAELAEDQVIAAAVLRMANSALYGGLTKITALQAAAARLGVRALGTLLMHESLRAATFHRKGGSKELARVLWRRALASACIMRELSRFTGMDEENAFLAGLLHDIGNVMVLRITQNDQVVARYGVDMDIETFEYFCFECHQEFGELIADAWSLPPNLKDIIRDHHSYPDTEDPIRPVRLQLLLADMINSLLAYSPFVPFNLLESRVVGDLGLADRDDFLAFLHELSDKVDDTVTSL